jgi:hypothetical protein
MTCGNAEHRAERRPRCPTAFELRNERRLGEEHREPPLAMAASCCPAQHLRIIRKRLNRSGGEGREQLVAVTWFGAPRKAVITDSGHFLKLRIGLVGTRTSAAKLSYSAFLSTVRARAVMDVRCRCADAHPELAYGVHSQELLRP